jgi:hypothetical protein
MRAPGHPPHAQTARPEVKLLKHPLSAERDALTARVAALQTQIQDASISQAPRWNFFPSPAAFWNFRPNLAPCLLLNFGTPSCDWLSTRSRKLKARPAAAPATESPIHTTPLEPATALPRPPQQTVSAPVPASVTPVDQKHDGDGSEPPVATQNRNTAKAEAKLEKALEYLININDHTDNRSEKWAINDSILFCLKQKLHAAADLSAGITQPEAQQQLILHHWGWSLPDQSPPKIYREQNQFVWTT